MASKAETKQLAAELLKITVIGQSFQSQHDVRLGEAYDEVYARLNTLGLPVWDKSAEMPNEITPHFVALMAWNKIDLYRVSNSLYQRILNKVGDDGAKAISSIRALMSAPYSPSENTDPTDY